MTDETLTIASSLPVAIQMSDLPEHPDKPGELTNPRIAVIHGNRHPDAVHGLGITLDVPADLFHAWVDRHPHLKAFLQVFSNEDLDNHRSTHSQFGYEPGLENADSSPTRLPEAAQEPATITPAPIAAAPPSEPPSDTSAGNPVTHPPLASP